VEFVRFESTLWSRISLVKRRDAAAVNQFVQQYRTPVLRFVKNLGFAEADAEDIVQEVFLRITKDDVLARADKAKGRFRSFLLGVTQNVVREEYKRRGTLKRGAGKAAVSLDAEEGALAEGVAAPPRDEAFDREWLMELVRRALGRLAGERPDHHKALSLHLQQGLAYEQIAEAMGKKLQDVKNYIHRARARLGELLKEEIGQYASSAEEYEEEVAYLSKFLE
jgi:RNA polymerase sigma-70 factor (ECF subfamily)